MTRQVWLRERDARIEDLLDVLADGTDQADYPLADGVQSGVLRYHSARLLRRAAADDGRREVQAELARALSDGPGIVVLQGAFDDLSVVDRCTAAFTEMIADQRASGSVAGDHFAKPGANDRVWAAHEKLAVADPEVFADYYANDIIALVCAAWLGPGYQVTSQVNVVNPGGAGQTVHRDYHLGFQSNEIAEQYPAHVHRLSPVLTLQGAVAHVDMPVVSGPTLYLPHSQKYELGYLAWRKPEFHEHFVDHHVQLPLAKGDAVFFNPALFHAAGSNHSTDVLRMANLLQVSSAFGRAMEATDRERMSLALYPTLLRRKAAGASDRWLANVVAASSEGYSFPTNLDRDQPVDGLAPETQAGLVCRALASALPVAELAKELATHAAKRHTQD
ncbi:MAG TPA: phytanoyl-CoA dioxygenase family protein [Dermatophilaceae bacterium]|nr:phytanoyl-CoA dioxygenase family protein [Dermatophilaceae bacterium]